jgi:tetratricopeptide (TPR) repeat protein
MAILERLAAHDAANTEWQRGLSISHERIGELLAAQGDLAGALLAQRASLLVRERLAARDATNAQWQQDVANAHIWIGIVLRFQGDLPGAIIAFRASLAINERLAVMDPSNVVWERALLLSHWQIADALLSVGDRASARPHALAAVAFARDRRARFPDQPQAATDLRNAQSLLGRVNATR